MLDSNKVDVDNKAKTSSKGISNVNNASQDQAPLEKSIIHIRLRATHKITFFLGVVFGVFALRHQLITDTSQV